MSSERIGPLSPIPIYRILWAHHILTSLLKNISDSNSSPSKNWGWYGLSDLYFPLACLHFDFRCGNHLHELYNKAGYFYTFGLSSKNVRFLYKRKLIFGGRRGRGFMHWNWKVFSRLFPGSPFKYLTIYIANWFMVVKGLNECYCSFTISIFIIF